MPLETKSQKVLLIDLENCPSQLEQLPTDLANYLQVLICYATSHSKLPLGWLLPLSNAILAKKLKIIKWILSARMQQILAFVFWQVH